MKHNFPSVLMISLATEIFTRKFCDTFNRHYEYAKRMKSLYMIVYTDKKDGFKPIRYKNLIVYPTNSASRIHFFLDVIKIGIQLLNRKDIDVITTQDPFATGLAGIILKMMYSITLDIQNHSDFIDNKKWIFENFPRNSFLNVLAKWIIQYGDTHRVLNAAANLIIMFNIFKLHLSFPIHFLSFLIQHNCLFE